VAGTSGGGLRFDGIDDSVEMAGLPSIAADNPRTITAWIKLSKKPTANQTILAWGEPTPGEHWRLEVDANRRLRFSCGAGYAVASRVVGDAQWHHVAAAFEPLVWGHPHVSDIRLYVDTQRQTIYDLNEQEVAAGEMGSLRIGVPYDPATSQPFDGILDDVQIFDSALTQATVRQVYDAAVPQQPSGD